MKQKKTKKKTVSSAKKKVWKIFSLYIRTRDCLKTTGCPAWGLCYTCSRRYHIKLLQAGHFIPGRHNSNLFEENGVKATCYNCNVNLYGNTLEFRDRLIEEYGVEEIERLRENAKRIVKFTVPELEEKFEYYKEKLKKLLTNDPD